MYRLIVCEASTMGPVRIQVESRTLVPFRVQNPRYVGLLWDGLGTMNRYASEVPLHSQEGEVFKKDNGLVANYKVRRGLICPR